MVRPLLVAAFLVACSQAFLLAPCASGPEHLTPLTAQLAELRLSRGQEQLEIEGAHLTVFQHRG